MSKDRSKSLYTGLAIAAALAALGTSAGVPQTALAQSSATVRREAPQLKFKAKQLKHAKGERGVVGGGNKLNPQPEPPKPLPPDRASGRMLNPQPLPPKSKAAGPE